MKVSMKAKNKMVQGIYDVDYKYRESTFKKTGTEKIQSFFVRIRNNEQKLKNHYQ